MPIVTLKFASNIVTIIIWAYNKGFTPSIGVNPLFIRILNYQLSKID